MIETSEQLYQAVEQMGRMQRILESYRNEILAKNPRNFALVAEGPLEQLRQLQKQIDEYIQGGWKLVEHQPAVDREGFETQYEIV
jgi:hypothetical protein